MKKIVIIIISIFLLLSAVNIGTSKPIINNDSIPETNYSIDNSISDNAQEQQILQNINRLDGYFAENRGQVGNNSVRYYVQGKGVWFLDDGVVFKIQEPIKETEIQRDPTDRFYPELESEKPGPRKSVVLKLNFEGCNEIKPKGVGLLPHRSNYFYGNDSNKWSTNVPNFQEVIYENIYDNIDLRYYSSEKGLKYDFIVRPGGNPEEIRMRSESVQMIYIDFIGNLILRTSLGDIVDSELFIYQESYNKENKIDGAFKKIDRNTYGFEIFGEYDRNQDTIIDPLIYSTYFGGSNYDVGNSITIDSFGNAYVTGHTESPNFPNTTGSYDDTFNAIADVFVLKLDPNGSSLFYSTFIGGGFGDLGTDIEIDLSGNTYVTGYTWSPDFPNSTTAYDKTHNGDYDVFVLKLNQTGSSLLYSTFIGGIKWDLAINIEIDSNSNAFVTGYTESSNFPNTTNAFNNTLKGTRDVFLLKLNSTGSKLLYSTYIGGSGLDLGGGLKLDSNGYVLISGWISSPDFPISIGAYDNVYDGGFDLFILKLNPAGTGQNDLIYSTYIGGSKGEWEQNMIIDSNDNIYVTGYTESFDFPNTTNAYDNTFNNNQDIFIFKLNPSGNGNNDLIYSTFVGGNGNDRGYGITIDNINNVYVTGSTNSSNFPVTSNAEDATHNGQYDVFLLKLDSTGSLLNYSTFFGGSNSDIGNKLTIDTIGNIFVTGRTDSTDFPKTDGAYDKIHNGDYDVFVFKLDFNNTAPIAIDLKISKPTIYRTNPIYLFSNATDIEDLEKNLTPILKYRDPNELVWNSTYFSTPQYKNSRWEVSFTPLKNATLGLYDFRVRFNDTFPSISNWLYLNDSLLVLNNIPAVEDISSSNNSALLGDSISIWINATDIEEIKENLTIDLEYRDPSEISWDKTDLSTPTYNNGRWESSFNIPFDALFGYYDFRTRCNDSDGNYSSWFYLNDSLLIYNTGPKVIDAKLSEILIYRTGSVYLFINGSDHETPEDMLSFFIQFKPQSEDERTNLTGNYLNNRWEVSYITNKESILGNYDFRVKFEDNESVSSGWKYINDSIEVLNNLPVISEDLDNISVGIQPLLFDLTPYESDIEDSGTDLTWSIVPQIYSYIESNGVIDIVNDTLKITPKENVTGTEDIELTLTDKDSGNAVKSDITINIDSTISESTPKVTLLAPVNNAVINSLTPTLKWELDYSGSDIITYTVALDESPDPQNTIIAGLTSTEYTLENELVDGKTYYWKVEPTNGICLSGAFRFTIDLGFEPIYKVNLTAEMTSVTIKQGATDDINLTVTNKGNSIDNFKIEIDSISLQSQASLDKTNTQLDPDFNSIIQLSIDIPNDFTTGDYEITVTASSLTDLTAKDEVTIDVKVVAKDFVPDYDVSISLPPTSLELDQGDTENVTITISNNGNIEDDFTISFESDDFTSANIQLSENFLTLPDGDSDTITVTIKIPEDMEPGVYTVKFIVESNDEPQESTMTITVKDKDGEEPKDGDEDNTMLYALVGIIVIIIVVLILLFIFLKKKKEKEAEPSVEEASPPPPEEVPPEVPPEQVPTPEVPPEQVPAPETPPSEQPPTPEVSQEQVPAPETPPSEQTAMPEVTPEQPPTPEVTPQVPQPQVESTPPEEVPQVEEQPVPQPQVDPQVKAQEPALEPTTEPQQQPPTPTIKTQPTIKEEDV